MQYAEEVLFFCETVQDRCLCLFEGDSERRYLKKPLFMKRICETEEFWRRRKKRCSLFAGFVPVDLNGEEKDIIKRIKYKKIISKSVF